MKKLTIAFAMMSVIANTNAFEFATHVAITANAWNRFIALDENKTLLVDLGLNKPVSQIFATTTYLDVSTQGPIPRYAGTEETASIAMAQFNPQYSLPGWILRGAIREDDDPRRDYDYSPVSDDPDNQIHRVFRHFYDPYNKRELTVLGKEPCDIDYPTPCANAVDWALGTIDFTTSLSPGTSRRNHFSLADAREALYRGLTGHDSAFGVTGLDAVTRQRYWVTAFRALGDVLHLNQDMAQPQHTRNDPHAGVIGVRVAGHTSTFEKFLEAGVTRVQYLRVGADTPRGGIPFTPAPMNYDGYPPVPDGSPPDVVRFKKYAEYWTEIANKGMADYTNRGLFTVGTNLGDFHLSTYPLPDPDVSHYTPVPVPAVQWDGTPVGATVSTSPTITMLEADVPDSYTGKPDQAIKLSARGSWDQFLTSSIAGRHYTLYRDNYVDQAKLVIPRAVGYSAGLLNHFFRGRLKINLPPEQVYAVADYSQNVGFQDFKVMVENVSKVTLSDGSIVHQNVATSAGTLVAVLRHRSNVCLKWPTLEGSPHWDPQAPHAVLWDGPNCRQPSLNEQYLPNIKVSLPAAVPDIDNGPQAVIFHFDDPLPFNAVDVDLQVVYRGPLGDEPDDIAIGLEQISEPTFYDFVNFGDCQMQTPQTCQDEACTWTGTAHLPAPEATPGPGQYDVVGVTKLPKGHYARAAFLTRSGMREQVTQLEPVTNQQYDYVQQVDYPDGEVDTWGPGEVIRSPLYSGRLLKDQATPPGFHPMLTWWSQGVGNTDCYGDDLSLCNMGVWASQSCTATNPPDWTPDQIQIYFLGQPQT